MPTLPPNPELTPAPSAGKPDIDTLFAAFQAQYGVQAQIVLPNLFIQGAQELIERLGIAEIALKEGPKIAFQPVQEMSKE